MSMVLYYVCMVLSMLFTVAITIIASRFIEVGWQLLLFGSVVGIGSGVAWKEIYCSMFPED